MSDNKAEIEMFAAGGAVMCLPAVALSALWWPSGNNVEGKNSSCALCDVCICFSERCACCHCGVEFADVVMAFLLNVRSKYLGLTVGHVGKSSLR